MKTNLSWQESIDRVWSALDVIESSWTDNKCRVWACLLKDDEYYLDRRAVIEAAIERRDCQREIDAWGAVIG